MVIIHSNHEYWRTSENTLFKKKEIKEPAHTTSFGDCFPITDWICVAYISRSPQQSSYNVENTHTIDNNLMNWTIDSIK